MKIVNFIKNIRKYIFFQILFDLIGVSCLAFAPLLQKYFFDNSINIGVKSIIKISILYLLLHCIYVISQYFCMIFAFKGAVRFEKSLKKTFFNSLFLRKDYEFRKREIGDYISFQANDIIALEQDYLQPFIDVIKSINMFLIYSLVLFFGIDWRIALIIIISSFLSIIIPKILGKKLEKSREVYQSELSKYVVKITDILQGFTLINNRTIKNIESNHENKLQDVADKRYLFGKQKSFTLAISLFSTKIVKVITFISIIILFYKKEISIGTGIATLSYVTALIDPIDNILYDITTMQSVKKIKDSYIDFVNYKSKDLIKINSFNKDIVLKNISYKYENFELKNINLTFEKGKKYLITGGNGTGKSTLLKIMAGSLKALDGYIEIDGQIMDNYDYSELITYIEQNDHIFNENVENNITVYNSYNYEHKQYENISLKINSIYKSDSTNCQKFSGGEKQIISLLRAFAKNSEILLMDEPFSAMDKTIEKEICKNLMNFKDKTIIMIAHNSDEEFLNMFDEIICI